MIKYCMIEINKDNPPQYRKQITRFDGVNQAILEPDIYKDTNNELHRSRKNRSILSAESDGERGDELGDDASIS